MNINLREAIDSMMRLVNTAGDVTGHDELDKAAKMEMIQYLMYLSASDGEIKWSEARIIKDYFDIDITPQTMNEFIRDNNIYSYEFEKTVPTVFSILVKLDNMLYERGDYHNEYTSELMVTAYKGIGMELVEADGDQDENERADMATYIEMLEDYLNENLLSRKPAVKTNFSKNGTTVVAPKKSGVSAPKKG